MELDKWKIAFLVFVFALIIIGVMHEGNQAHEVRMAELGYTHVDGNWIKSK